MLFRCFAGKRPYSAHEHIHGARRYALQDDEYARFLLLVVLLVITVRGIAEAALPTARMYAGFGNGLN